MNGIVDDFVDVSVFRAVVNDFSTFNSSSSDSKFPSRSFVESDGVVPLL